MDSAKRLELISKNLEEVITADDLKMFLENGVPLKHYIGYEISGNVHIGSGLVAGNKIKDFQSAGAKCSIYLATWHAWINNKLDGRIETIRKASALFKEQMIASMKAVKADEEKIKFVTGDELYHNNDEYWMQVIEIAKHMNLNDGVKATTIMGRQMKESMPLAFLLYPPMQAADIFIQDLTLAHAGLDQRKAQIIAREVGDKIKIHPLKTKTKQIKPVLLHHGLLPGLQTPREWPIPKEKLQAVLSEMKMSKSIPDSAIFLTDSAEEIQRKISKAFCPEKDNSYNPVLSWAKQLVFVQEKASLNVERLEKFGGNKTFYSFQELEKDFLQGALHPMDLKNAMSSAVIELMKPAHKHLNSGKVQKLQKELKEIMGK